MCATHSAREISKELLVFSLQVFKSRLIPNDKSPFIQLARFVVGNIDPRLLAYGPRKMILDLATKHSRTSNFIGVCWRQALLSSVSTVRVSEELRGSPCCAEGPALLEGLGACPPENFAKLKRLCCVSYYFQLINLMYRLEVNNTGSFTLSKS